jgi:hypothetical protein
VTLAPGTVQDTIERQISTAAERHAIGRNGRPQAALTVLGPARPTPAQLDEASPPPSSGGSSRTGRRGVVDAGTGQAASPYAVGGREATEYAIGLRV